MALIYLWHDTHGHMEVYSDTAAAECEKAGWVRKVHPAEVARQSAAPVIPAKSEPEAVDAWLNGSVPAKPTLSRKGK